MKEFVAIARNIYQTVNEDTGVTSPGAELVITVSEPKPVIANGKMSAVRELSDVRFACSIEALKMLAVTSVEIIESMEKLQLIKKKEEVN